MLGSLLASGSVTVFNRVVTGDDCHYVPTLVSDSFFYMTQDIGETPLGTEVMNTSKCVMDFSSHSSRLYCSPVEYDILDDESRQGYYTLRYGDFVVNGDKTELGNISANVLSEIYECFQINKIFIQDFSSYKTRMVTA